MKKSLIFALAILILILPLSSCDVLKFDKCHPTNSPLSKWEGYADNIHYELYIADENNSDLMIIDYGNKRIAYLVSWHRDYSTQMSIKDIRNSTLDEDSNYQQSSHLKIDCWNVKLIDENQFKLVKSEADISDAICDIPELMLSNEITMTRVHNDLSDKDFTEIQRDESHDLCPKYKYGSQWVSDDDQITINNINSLNGTSKVTFKSAPNSTYHIAFFEVDSKAYLVKQEGSISSSMNEFRNSSEEWQCEYFEDHFTARIIRSDFYEAGHVLTFTAVEMSQKAQQ